MFMNNPSHGRDPVYQKLCETFLALLARPGLALSYELGKQLPGLEVLVADPQWAVAGVRLDRGQPIIEIAHESPRWGSDMSFPTAARLERPPPRPARRRRRDAAVGGLARGDAGAGGGPAPAGAVRAAAAERSPHRQLAQQAELGQPAGRRSLRRWRPPEEAGAVAHLLRPAAGAGGAGQPGVAGAVAGRPLRDRRAHRRQLGGAESRRTDRHQHRGRHAARHPGRGPARPAAGDTRRGAGGPLPRQRR